MQTLNIQVIQFSKMPRVIKILKLLVNMLSTLESYRVKAQKRTINLKTLYFAKDYIDLVSNDLNEFKSTQTC